MPFTVVVDYFGYRVLATAVCPIDITRFNENGDIRTTKLERVYGTFDRGKTVQNENKLLDFHLQKAAKKLNLATHGVKGTQDLTTKYISGSCTMKGFKGHDGHLYLMDFRRAFPGEDARCTRHLPSAPRGQSIFWRMLRPELVKSNPEPLSPDTNSLITGNSPDWEKQLDGVYAATKRMTDVVLPHFAEELAKRTLESLETLDLTEEMHRRGINMRHLGLLRNRFWRKLSRRVSVIFNHNQLLTTGPY